MRIQGQEQRRPADNLKPGGGKDAVSSIVRLDPGQRSPKTLQSRMTWRYSVHTFTILTIHLAFFL